MKKEPINYSAIDPGIRDLVSILNEIPFVRTQESCEGHLRDNLEFECVYPDQGHKFLSGGAVIMKVDRRYKLAGEFLKEIKHLESRYSFVELSEHHCNDPGCAIENSFTLDLDYTDLTHPELIDVKGSFEQVVKKRYQVATKVGERRVAKYKQVWSEFFAIAQKYVELTKTS